MNTLIKFLLSIGMLMQVFLCSLPPVASGTETDTGTITGLVTDVSRRPMTYAAVLLHNPDSMNTDTTRTDSRGIFLFDKVAFGKYYVEATADDLSGALVEASVQSNQLVVELDTIVTRNYGAIKGSLDLSLLGESSASIYVIALNRTVTLDSTGQFLINNVPESDYAIRLIKNDTIVKSSIDTLVIPVIAKDTTEAFNLGTKSGDITIQGVIHE